MQARRNKFIVHHVYINNIFHPMYHITHYRMPIPLLLYSRVGGLNENLKRCAQHFDLSVLFSLSVVFSLFGVFSMSGSVKSDLTLFASSRTRWRD